MSDDSLLSLPISSEQMTNLDSLGYQKITQVQAESLAHALDGWCCRTTADDGVRDRILVVWHKLSDDPEKDAAVLEAVLNKKGLNQADSEYDLIYINDSQGLQLPGVNKSRLMSFEGSSMAKTWEDC